MDDIVKSRLDPAKIRGLAFPRKEFAYADSSTMLYALSVGLARSPTDMQELPFATERNLKALPTQAAVVAWDDSWLPATGIDVSKVVHGEQRITLHKPVPPEGRVGAEVRVIEAYDKGVGRGALLFVETKLDDLVDGSPLATMHSTVFARGDGGFGGPAGSPPAMKEVPGTTPDLSLDCATLPNQALFYRLLGDRNPLHSDPEFARSVGFDRPILHGLCTYGIAIAAIVKGICEYDPAKVRHMEARFTAPVYPGETVTTEIWHQENGVAFRASVASRSAVVLDRGRVEFFA